MIFTRSPGSLLRPSGMLVLLSLLGSSCMTTGDRTSLPKLDASFIRENSTVNRDPDNDILYITTPPYFPEGRYAHQVSLIAEKAPEDPVRFQVYLFTKRIDWANFDRALGPEGDILEMKIHNRSVGGPNALEERVGAFVSRETLESALTSELKIVFVGAGGQQPIILPGFIIEGFLAKVDRIHGTPPPEGKSEKQGEPPVGVL